MPWFHCRYVSKHQCSWKGFWQTGNGFSNQVRSQSIIPKKKICVSPNTPKVADVEVFDISRATFLRLSSSTRPGYVLTSFMLLVARGSQSVKGWSWHGCLPVSKCSCDNLLGYCVSSSRRDREKRERAFRVLWRGGNGCSFVLKVEGSEQGR